MLVRQHISGDGSAAACSATQAAHGGRVHALQQRCLLGACQHRRVACLHARVSTARAGTASLPQLLSSIYPKHLSRLLGITNDTGMEWGLISCMLEMASESWRCTSGRKPQSRRLDGIRKGACPVVLEQAGRTGLPKRAKHAQWRQSTQAPAAVAVAGPGRCQSACEGGSAK